MRYHRNKIWVCPYFQKAQGPRMYCEGGCVQFPAQELNEAYFARFCTSYNWEQCGLAQALTEYYNRKEK